MPTALIAEDEPLLAEHLTAELRRLWPALGIVAQVGDGASAAREALARTPDVCFLDIRMPGATGLEAAQMLAEDWPTGPDAPDFPLLVFVTAYDQYALQAFDAQAVDYLVKPVEPARLAACIARLQRRLDARPGAAQGQAQAEAHGEGEVEAEADSQSDAAAPPQARQGHQATLEQALAQLRGLLGVAAEPPRARLEVIQASAGNTVHLVPVADVLYFEAADKYVRVVTAEREHLIRTSLRELVPQLDAGVFWQVHRSLVVRAAAIATAVREESGKVTLHLRGRQEKLTASRLYAHLFKGM